MSDAAKPQPEPGKQPPAEQNPPTKKAKGPVFTGPRLKKQPGRDILDDRDVVVAAAKEGAK